MSGMSGMSGMRERGSMETVEERVEQLARELRRLGGRLLEAAAEHPDRERARQLSAAARVLVTSVMAPLEQDGTAVADPGPAEAEPQDAVAVRPTPSAGGALAELIEMYVSKHQRQLDEPVMTDPSLPWEERKPLRRFGYGDEAYFRTAPLWHDAVPSRGKPVARVTPKTEVLRRMHHRYVLTRDLDSPEGELAIRILLGCRAICGSRAVRDGGYYEWHALDDKLAPLQWRALVTAAERTAEAGARLGGMLRKLERLAEAVHKLDTLFRGSASDPALAEGIPGALRVVDAIVKELPGA
ncbi:hypothetical protein [Streptomyces sp. WG-D5]